MTPVHVRPGAGAPYVHLLRVHQCADVLAALVAATPVLPYGRIRDKRVSLLHAHRRGLPSPLAPAVGVDAQRLSARNHPPTVDQRAPHPDSAALVVISV